MQRTHTVDSDEEIYIPSGLKNSEPQPPAHSLAADPPERHSTDLPNALPLHGISIAIGDIRSLSAYIPHIIAQKFYKSRIASELGQTKAEQYASDLRAFKDFTKHTLTDSFKEKQSSCEKRSPVGAEAQSLGLKSPE